MTNRTIYLSIFLFCTSLLAAAIYLEVFEGQKPCPLCMIQRVFYLGVAIFALIAAIHNPAQLGTRIYSTVVGLLALSGSAVAARQVWLQHLPPDQVPECGPGLTYLLESFPLTEALAEIMRGSGECAESGWRFFSLSIAEWSLVFFVILVIVSLIQWTRKRPRNAKPIVL